MSNFKTSISHQKRLKKTNGKRRRGEEPCGEKRRNSLLLGLRWHCQVGPRSSDTLEIGFPNSGNDAIEGSSNDLGVGGRRGRNGGVPSSVIGVTRKSEIRRENLILIHLGILVTPMYYLTFQSDT
ncbi:hypothetical protein EUGRSUZ_G00842 [Eucalyptus grandis]|uniref:Uncharacterized protein n=2 Tax=Eucalyptus grandis TaxID=71139 RepID=A0ACC3K286_EUCGR|nr:hypothetical protein EUGRSUZ_G00842 [Eucalyptus grandis]